MQDLEPSETYPDHQVYIGIDVSKERLDIYIYPDKTTFAVENNKAGHKKLVKRLAALGLKCLIVMEATGRHHRSAHEQLTNAGFDTCVANPYQTRCFGKAMGVITKTDKVDARILAHYGKAMRPAIQPVLPETLRALKELVVTRHQFTARRTEMSNQLSECDLANAKKLIRAQISMITRHIAKCDADIKELIASVADLKNRFEIITSVPGVGFVNAFTLIAGMPELGSLDEKQVASLLGVAPHANQSGKHKGKSTIRAGRKVVRNTFYMAALSAVKNEPSMKALHHKLLSKGKPFKVSITAVMRKMIVMINALIKDNRKWVPKHS